jgi:hypothetical protein
VVTKKTWTPPKLTRFDGPEEVLAYVEAKGTREQVEAVKEMIGQTRRERRRA